MAAAVRVLPRYGTCFIACAHVQAALLYVLAVSCCFLYTNSTLHVVVGTYAVLVFAWILPDPDVPSQVAFCRLYIHDVCRSTTVTLFVPDVCVTPHVRCDPVT
jgi:hypothetical protein